MSSKDNSFRYKSQTSLFLVEVIIAVFFFAITAVVCIRIFVKAHTITDRSREMTQSYIEADNMAQVFMNYGGNIDGILSKYSEYALTLSQEGNYTGVILICFDKDFKPISHPTDNIDETISSTAYELILTQTLVDAADLYSDCSPATRIGFACDATIYVFDTKLSDFLITDTHFDDLNQFKDNTILTLPLDLYLGDIDTEA